MHLDLEPSALHRHAASQLRRRRKDLEGGPLAWIVPRAVSSWVFGLALTLVLPGFLGGGLGIIDLSATSFWLRLLGPAFVAAAVVPATYVMVRKTGSKSAEELVGEWEGQWTRLTRENRLLSVVGFTLLTAGWTAPLAFVARWATVASFRAKGLLRPSQSASKA